MHSCFEVSLISESPDWTAERVIARLFVEITPLISKFNDDELQLGSILVVGKYLLAEPEV